MGSNLVDLTSDDVENDPIVIVLSDDSESENEEVPDVRLDTNDTSCSPNESLSEGKVAPMNQLNQVYFKASMIYLMKHDHLLSVEDIRWGKLSLELSHESQIIVARLLFLQGPWFRTCDIERYFKRSKSSALPLQVKAFN